MTLDIKGKPLPKVFINSVPKSGTNLLTQIVTGIPEIRDKHGFYYLYNREKVLGVHAGEWVGGHIQYDKAFSNRLKQNGIKQVFIYRDLRDITVSMLHFIKEKYPCHPLAPYFKSHVTNHDRQLMVLIKGVNETTEEGVVRYPGIYSVTKEIYSWRLDPSVCSVRYEDLMRSNGSRKKEILKLIHYLFPEMKDRGEIRRLSHSMINHINPYSSWTYRKGKIGDWRDEFTAGHKTAFKEAAGDFLIELGYEKNHNW